jgi:predicted tellurium resistance membrane protein TerC
MGRIASGFPARERQPVLLLGMSIALVFLVAFALTATCLLNITGLLLAGGLFFGLTLSVTLMGLAANLVAKLVQRYHWIAWIGLCVLLYVALNMIWDGWWDIQPVVV